MVKLLTIPLRNDVAAHVGWGFCDKMCFQYTQANDLQVLSESIKYTDLKV